MNKTAIKQHYYTSSEANIVSINRSNIHRPILLHSHSTPADPTAPSPLRTLDGFMLLEASTSGIPDDARQATLTGRQLYYVTQEDLAFFTGLQLLDVSENYLTIAQFVKLPCLKELRLACNAITTISSVWSSPQNMSQSSEDIFVHLMALDLSFNRIDVKSIQSLYVLPVLRDLDLCGNELCELPLDMAAFTCLEKLLLERNKLQDPECMVILSTIPNLRILSVAYNFLSIAPQQCNREGHFQ